MIRYSCVLLFVLFAVTLAANEDLVKFEDLKDFLPRGFDTKAFKMHSGYLKGGPEGDTKKLHYIFYESANSPKSDPVVFWMGTDLKCSTMFNAFYGTGPFGFIQQMETTIENDNPWNAEANVIYIDGPVGVGFSKSERSDDYTTDDEKTAEAFFQAILSWHKKYPQFVRNDFYLAGEAYAGIWAPMVAKKIQYYNEDEGSKSKQINLVGMMLGNPFTDWDIDGGMMPLENLYYRGIYGTKIRNDYLANCPKNPNSAKCNTTKILIKEIMNDVNDYDLAGRCNYDFTPGSSNHPTMNEIAEQRRLHKIGHPLTTAAPGDSVKVLKCHAVKGLRDMFERRDVMNALNIDHDSITSWTMCSTKVNYDTSSSVGSFEIYKELLATPLRILIFSGDTDGVVPTMTTLAWVRKLQKQMNLMTTSPWEEWLVEWANQKEAAGFTQTYNKKFTIATIRGAPHSVATKIESRPTVHHLIQNWLRDFHI